MPFWLLLRKPPTPTLPEIPAPSREEASQIALNPCTHSIFCVKIFIKAQRQGRFQEKF